MQAEQQEERNSALASAGLGGNPRPRLLPDHRCLPTPARFVTQMHHLVTTDNL